MADTKKELNLEELEKAAGGAYQRYFRYIVQSGDTLESVAKHFYMSVECNLKSLNNISGTGGLLRRIADYGTDAGLLIKLQKGTK